MNQINVYYKDTIALPVTFKGDNGFPIDITGQRIIFTIKNKITDDDIDALITFNAVMPNNDDSQKGIARIYINNSTILEKTKPGAYVYGVTQINSNIKQTILIGQWCVLPVAYLGN